MATCEKTESKPGWMSIIISGREINVRSCCPDCGDPWPKNPAYLPFIENELKKLKNGDKAVKGRCHKCGWQGDLTE